MILTRHAPKRLVLNLAEVPYMDSSAVAVLVETLQKMRKAGGKVYLSNLQPRVQGLIEIARLGTIFVIVKDEAEALSVAPAEIDLERRGFVESMRNALSWAVARLAPKDRLRLACYYAQQMTLAEVYGKHVTELAAPKQWCGPRRVARKRGTGTGRVLPRYQQVGNDVRVDDDHAGVVSGPTRVLRCP